MFFTLFEASYDSFIETVPINGLLQRSLGQMTENFAGVYYLYSLSSMKKRISKLPMIIRPDGSAELKARPFTERVDIGKAVYNGTNRLSVYLESSGRGSYSHLLFNTGNRWREGTQYIYGVSSRFNSEDHPSARLEVLVVAGDENFEDMKAVAFDIGTNEFYRQDEAADGILSYLRMNSLQTAVSRYQPNIAVAPIRKVDLLIFTPHVT